MGAAKHAAISKRAHRLFAELAACGHGRHELAVTAVDQGLQDRTLPLAEGFIGGKDVLIKAAFHGFKADANALQQLFEVVAPKDHADGTGDGAGVGHDAIGGAAHIDPA